MVDSPNKFPSYRRDLESGLQGGDDSAMKSSRKDRGSSQGLAGTHLPGEEESTFRRGDPSQLVPALVSFGPRY